jgi:hypothetical protein
MYLPIKTLLSLAVTAKAENMILDHIVLNVNDVPEKYNGLNLLAFSIQNRLSRLVPLFLKMGYDSDLALEIAISNGDDQSVADIFKHLKSIRKGFDPSKYISMSQSLGYHRITRRIILAVSEDSDEEQEGLDVSNEFAEIEVDGKVEDESESDREYDDGGYLLKPELVFSPTASSNKCRIARLSVEDVLSNR